MTEYADRLNQLEDYPKQIKGALIAAEGDRQVADLLGVIDANARVVAGHRKMGLSEIPDRVMGHRYSLKPKGGKYVRSYNFSTLLSKLMDGTGMKLLDLLIYLRDKDALRFSWQWTNLGEVIREYNIEITKTNRPILDGDSADIGEDWKDGAPGFTRIEEG